MRAILIGLGALLVVWVLVGVVVWLEARLERERTRMPARWLERHRRGPR